MKTRVHSLRQYTDDNLFKFYTIKTVQCKLTKTFAGIIGGNVKRNFVQNNKRDAVNCAIKV